MLRLFVICVALALCACADNEAKQLGKIRDEICACKTSKCAEAALQRVPKPKGNTPATPRAQHVAREMMDCLAELYESERPTQDPDAEEPTVPNVISAPGTK